MSAANEKVMGDLHGKIADAIIGVLDRHDAEVQAVIDAPVVQDEETGEDVPKFVPEINVAILSAGIKFLKDNDVTCVVGEGSKAADLRERLAKRKKVNNILHGEFGT